MRWPVHIHHFQGEFYSFKKVSIKNYCFSEWRAIKGTRKVRKQKVIFWFHMPLKSIGFVNETPTCLAPKITRFEPI